MFYCSAVSVIKCIVYKVIYALYNIQAGLVLVMATLLSRKIERVILFTKTEYHATYHVTLVVYSTTIHYEYVCIT